MQVFFLHNFIPCLHAYLQTGKIDCTLFVRFGRTYSKSVQQAESMFDLARPRVEAESGRYAARYIEKEPSMLMTASQRRALLLSLLIIGLTVGAVGIIYSTEPEAPKDGATRSGAMPVTVARVQPASYTPKIQVMGEVVPARQIALRPRVAGRVTEVSDALIPGNIVSEGQWLMRLDEADYQLAVRQAEAELARAQSRLAIEMGEQERAKKDLAGLRREVPQMNRELILRQPQLQQANADVRSAQVAIEQAQLALDRTTIRMPFEGQILTQQANLGSQLSPADTIATLVGTQRYWVQAQVPAAQLKWLPRTDSVNPVTATITHDQAWPAGATRTGIIKQTIAALDQQTRMATVLIEVTDPLARSAETTDLPLIAGSYVQVLLPTAGFDGVVRLPVAWLRKDDTVWLADNEELRIARVTVAFRNADYVFIKSGLAAGALVITTNLAAVRDGVPVRITGNTPTTAESP